MGKIICINGKFFNEKKAVIPALDNGFLYGDACYDTMRTYKGVVLELDQHVERILHSTQVLNIRVTWTKKELKKWIQETVKRNKVDAARVRLTISRGANGLDFTTTKKPLGVVTCEALHLNPKSYTHGVAAVTTKLERIFPGIKTTGLAHMIMVYKDLVPQGIYEAIMINREGYVTEGATTNVMVVKNGKIITPKSGILLGMTRKRVLSLAKKLHIPVLEKNFKIGVLKSADEIFLTNRPREIIPVTQLNGKKVGDGKVGPLSKKIMEEYQKYVQDQIGA